MEFARAPEPYAAATAQSNIPACYCGILLFGWFARRPVTAGQAA